MGRENAEIILAEAVRYLVNDSSEVPAHNDIDWWEVAAAAERHRVAPFLGYNRKKIELFGFDNFSSQRLYLGFLRARSLRASQDVEISNIIDDAVQNGDECSGRFPTILLKGSALAHMIYEDPGARHVGDIDFLVDARDIDALAKSLARRGYKQIAVIDSDVPLGIAKIYARAQQHEIPFVRRTDEGGFSVDLHTRTYTDWDRIRIRTDYLRDNTRGCLVGGRRVACLNAEASLIHLCYHLYWHTRSMLNILSGDDVQLHRFLDIDLLIRRCSPNWKSVLDAVHEQSLQVPCAYSLFGAIKLLGTPVPKKVMDRLVKPEHMHEVNGMAERWLLGTDQAFAEWDGSIFNRLFDTTRALEASTALYHFLLKEYDRNKLAQAYAAYYSSL